MEEENKKKVKIFVIILLVLLVVTVILYIVSKQNKKADKVLSGRDYIVEKETDYSEIHGPLPSINLKGDEIEKINKEIMSKYYNIAISQDNSFNYVTSTYKDLLSVLLTVVRYDGSEYGAIEYYSYNINLRTNEVLTKGELLKYLNISSTAVNDAINNRLKDYYNKDTLKKEIKFDEYLKVIAYDSNNIRLYIKENKLYCYVSLRTTKSLIDYTGNFNEIEIMDLSK